MKKVKVGKHSIEISNPDKIIFPKSKITKLEFVEYYKRIAPKMLPYLKNRPISMKRYPDGIQGKGFFQKDASPYFPDWIKRTNVPKEGGGMVHYVVCNNAATLVYLAQQLMMTPHIWLSSLPKLKFPIESFLILIHRRVLILQISVGRPENSNNCLISSSFLHLL